VRISQYTDNRQTLFVLSAVDLAYHAAVRDRAFGPSPMDGDFARGFPTDTPHLDHIYRTFEHDVEAMVAQAARAQPVPWERALDAFLRLVAPHGVDWWLCGSVALAARGLDVAPRDLDLVVAGADASRLGDIAR
jgi:hypothetical protein